MKAIGTNEPVGRATARDLNDVVDELMSRRNKGENVTDEQIIAQYPHLLPALGEELATLRDIQLAALSAHRAGPVVTPVPLAEEQLSAPISVDSAVEPDEGAEATARPVITGYTILDLIGYGGQGSVYQAIQQCTNRKVAIKIMQGGACADSRSRLRFERERQILASLSHPNIVSVIDAGGTADGSFYFVMPFIAGASMEDFLLLGKRPQPAALLERIGLCAKVADAIGEAHRNGIIHRDLKPSNIRVDQRGEPYVLDFGLAHSANSQAFGRTQAITFTGQMVGSIPWFSPEQAGGGHVDQRSDVYALGVILYQTVIGRTPYPSVGPLRDVLNHIVKTVPTPPSTLVALFGDLRDQRLDAIILKALAKDRAVRYASAAELALELRELLAAAPGRAGRPRWRPSSRTMILSGVGLCATALLTFGTIKQLGGHTATRGAVPPSTGSGPVSISAGLENDTYINSLGMRLIKLPAGTFLMGSPADDYDRRIDEQQHPVILTKGFWMASFPTTRRQYDAIMGVGAAGSEQPGDEYVDRISWSDAVKFCVELSRREGRTYRLPTEAEWEYAARTFAAAKTGESHGSMHPAIAAAFPDMYGGVEQWCSDFFGKYPNYAVTDPPGALRSFQRVIRGGQSLDLERTRRVTHRDGKAPEIPLPHVGFRVVADVLRPSPPVAAATKNRTTQ